MIMLENKVFFEIIILYLGISMEQNKINIRVANNDMEAYILVNRTEEEETISKEELNVALAKSGVVYGIDEELLDQIASLSLFDREFLIAKGEAPVDGVDGYFEYKFNTDLNHKPLLREDGTVDYWSIHLVEMVEAGQIVAIYHDPIDCTDGKSVKGKTVLAKRGKGLPPIAGRGFERSEDNYVYTSLIDGKIELSNRRLTILPVYEISSDVDMHTGNIDFRGDVIVHGNIRSGMSVKATGTVTVDGMLEAGTIEGTKGIVLRGGVQGGGKARLISESDIQAKYIEYAYVETKGAVISDSLIDCKVVCYDEVRIEGKHSSIVGGSVYGTRSVKANNIGSSNNIATEILAGMRTEELKDLFMLQSEVYDIQSTIDKIDLTLKDNAEKTGMDRNELNKDPRRVALLRAKVEKQAELSQKNLEIKRLQQIVDESKNASVTVNREVFPGVTVAINNIKTQISDVHEAVIFEENDKNLRMYSLYD